MKKVNEIKVITDKVSSIFKSYNARLLFNIMNDGTNYIEAKSFIDPREEVFNQPLINKNGIHHNPKFR